MRSRTFTLAAGILAAALLLAGCTPTDHDPGHGMDHGAPGTTATESAEENAFNHADSMFVEMMIPHHEQAITMSDQILMSDGIDPRVVALAEQIKAAQGPEIETMRAWLEDWGIAYDDSISHGSMDHGGGMMTEEELAALNAATGEEAMHLFLEGMIVHHEGAVEMARSALEHGENTAVRSLAQQIVDGQNAEVTVMRDILASL